MRKGRREIKEGEWETKCNDSMEGETKERARHGESKNWEKKLKK